MRILASLTLLVVGTLANEGQFLTAQEYPVINYDKGLSCGACVLGGYVFVYLSLIGTSCCKVDDSACWSG